MNQTLNILDGFWGMKWKSSGQVIENHLYEKSCVIDNKIINNSFTTLFIHGTFTDQNVPMVIYLINDEFYQADICYTYVTKKTKHIKMIEEVHNSRRRYEELLTQLCAKYGEPSNKKYEIDTSGNQEIFAEFDFPNGSWISIEIREVFSVYLIYSCLDIAKSDSSQQVKISCDL